MKRLINWLKFDCLWLKLLVSLVIGAIVYGLLYAVTIFAVIPTEKDFAEMESQILEIQKSPEILLEPDRKSSNKDGLIEVMLTDKKMIVRFDKDFNVISKCNQKDKVRVELALQIVSAIIGLFVAMATYYIFKMYMPMDYEKETIEHIKRKINSAIFNLKLKLKKKA